MKLSTLKIPSLSALTLALTLTACGADKPRPDPVKPPAELVQPLRAEPELGAGNNSLTVADYIGGLRDFACEARARFNALRAHAMGEEQPDPNAGRCASPEQPTP